LFDYSNVKDFVSLELQLEYRQTNRITLARAYYKDATATTPGDDNIPPIVFRDDIYLSNNQTTASVIATAYDPDGFIISQEWDQDNRRIWCCGYSSIQL
jgi:hypothetical protein